MSMTAPGAEPAIALAFASAVGASEHFAKSRAVKAYAGLALQRIVPVGTEALAIAFPELQAGRLATGNARRTVGRRRHRPLSRSESANRPAKTPQVAISPAERPRTEQRNPTERPGTGVTAPPELDNPKHAGPPTLPRVTRWPLGSRTTGLR